MKIMPQHLFQLTIDDRQFCLINRLTYISFAQMTE